MSGVIRFDWRAPGPVAARFMGSSKRVQILNGPVGSGKTVACLNKILKLARLQKPIPGLQARDGSGQLRPVRQSRFGIVRDTYRQLHRTTIRTWDKRVVPRSAGEWKGADDAPSTHRITFDPHDGTLVDLEVIFIAIGENAAEDVMRGFEVTGWYLNELDLLARDVFSYAKSRWGRFPDMDTGGPSWWGILADCNAPEYSSWLYEDIFRLTPDERAALDTELFVQPSGFSPAAENLANLVPGYYADQAKGQPDWFVARMIENKPGYSRAGKPIYPEFVDALHVAPFALEPLPHLGLVIGLDAGLSPAAVIAQHSPTGQWLILDELVSEHGTGPTRFGANLARLLADRYRGITRVRIYADPSSAWGADRQAGEQDWMQIVGSQLGIPIEPAPTNEWGPRSDAVRRPLTLLIEGRPMFQLSPRCKVLREGFNSGYRFRKMNVISGDRYDDKPEKNDYSHPHDALQYVMMGGGEYMEILARSTDRAGRARQSVYNDYD